LILSIIITIVLAFGMVSVPSFDCDQILEMLASLGKKFTTVLGPEVTTEECQSGKYFQILKFKKIHNNFYVS
jgi:hypothetical protein